MSKQSASNDAIALLTQDHEHVLRMFDNFRALQDDEEQDDERQNIVEQACAELRIHSQIEEELFYPALRDTMDQSLLVDEALVEHEVASQLISDLESMQAGDDQYDAKFIVLGEYIRHHIEEEQEKLFPLAKKSGLDLEAIGEDLRQRKEELRAEFGLPEPEEDEDRLPPPTTGQNGGKRSGRHART